MLKQIFASCDEEVYEFVKHKASFSGPLVTSILFLSQTKQMQRAVNDLCTKCQFWQAQRKLAK